jgi:hypothetical protein
MRRKIGAGDAAPKKAPKWRRDEALAIPKFWIQLAYSMQSL